MATLTPIADRRLAIMVDEGLDRGRGGASAEAPDHWRVPPGPIGVREVAPSYAVAR